MSLSDLAAALPPYAADVAESLRLLGEDRALSDVRRSGCLLACAHALGEPKMLEALGEDGLDADWRKAVRAAASVMAMNSVYYRAVHSMDTPQYATLPARLSMRGLGSPPIPKPDFDLLCLSLAAVFGCGVCLDAHEKELRTGGTEPAVMQAALRAAAIAHACAVVLRDAAAADAARARQGGP